MAYKSDSSGYADRMAPKSMEELIYAFLYGLGQDIREGRELFANTLFYLQSLTRGEHDETFKQQMYQIDTDMKNQMGQIPDSHQEKFKNIVRGFNFRKLDAIMDMLIRSGLRTVKHIEVDG